MNKKFKIYECLRSPLYSPIYLAKSISKDYNIEIYELDEYIKTKKGHTIRKSLGDKGAIEMLKDHSDSTSIPIAICDPTAIFDIKEGANDQIIVISTLINRISIWLVTIYYEFNESKNERHQNLFNKIYKNEEIELSDLHNKKIYYCDKGITTKKIFNHFFCSDKYSIGSDGLEDFGWESELDCLTDSKLNEKDEILVLSNAPWLLEEVIKNHRLYENIKNEGAKVEYIYDFGPDYHTFTSLVTRRDAFEDYEEDIFKLIFMINNIIIDMYNNPRKYVSDLFNSFDFDFWSRNIQTNAILHKTIYEFLLKRIYPHFMYTDWFSWYNSIILDKGLVKKYPGDKSKLNYNLIVDNSAVEEFLAQHGLLHLMMM